MVSGVPAHTTWEALTKFVPVTVRVKGALPALAKAGLRVAMVGPTAKFTAVEGVDPFTTVIAYNPVGVSRPLPTVALITVEVGVPTVVSAVVPHFTTEPATKFVPVTVSVKEAVPSRVEDGLSEAIAGPETLNVVPEEATLPFWTVTSCDGVALSTLPKTATVSWVALL